MFPILDRQYIPHFPIHRIVCKHDHTVTTTLTQSPSTRVPRPTYSHPCNLSATKNKIIKSPHPMAMMMRVCELCGEEEAAFYCRSDVAFLCCKCDARVHEMNFLSARHVRQPICRGCKEIMTGDYISGSGLRNGVWFALCNSCSVQRQDDGESLSSSSSCISSTNCSNHEKPRMGSNKPVVTKPRKVVGARVRALFESWCRKIGVADIDVVVAVASRIFVAAWDGSAPGLWFAASLWLSLRVRRMASFEKMRRLVEVSGVPERMISVAQARIAGRMLKDRKILRGGGEVVEEGWAESC